MVLKEINVEVLGIDRNIDIENGSPSAVVVFGHLVDSTDEIKERVSAGGQTPNPNKTVVNRIIFFVPDALTLPYTIGSKWIIRVQENGDISIAGNKT